jgi:hypothetical protein
VRAERDLDRRVRRAGRPIERDGGHVELGRHARLPGPRCAESTLRGAPPRRLALSGRVEFGAAIPALIVSGASAPDDLNRIMATGMPLLHKPVAPAKLRSALAFLLGAR